ncbi:phage tail protein [Pectobacterium aroidearum]|uniref:phage tail protein n=1 Tax=Pectobacterium aroidearum TaxID=1201031 RepID=UPI0032EFEF48
MALSLLAANNAQTVLSAGISAAATTLTVNTGAGVLFPSPTPGVSFFKLTLIDAATGTLTEIVHVTQRTGDTMTIARGQEGTAARIWSANDLAANMMTAGTLSYLLETTDGKLAKDQNGADIPNKQLFRENVGLVKQTSLDDTTSGSLVINGGHGLGANARPRAAGATGGAAGCNFFSYTANHVDNPFGSTGASGIHVQEAATYGWDLLGRNGGGIGFRVRQISNGAASSWSELWTSANLANPMTTDTAQTISSIKTFTQYPRAPGYHVRTTEATPRDVAYLRGLPADQSKAELFANLSSLFLRSPTDTYVSANCGYTGNAWYKTDPSKESRVLSVTTGGLTVSSSPAGNPEAIVRTDPILVRGINAVTDANGFYKTPGSTGDTISTSDMAGIPLPFPGAVAPTGWLKCNGQQFDTAQFPVLASRYPSGFLPDLRGEFVRGWDDGRGADAGRALLSAQSDAIRNITGSMFYGYDADGGAVTGYDSGALRYGTVIANDSQRGYTWGQDAGAAHWYSTTFDASRVVPTASENRPRNIAFNYIVRAA